MEIRKQSSYVIVTFHNTQSDEKRSNNSWYVRRLDLDPGQFMIGFINFYFIVANNFITFTAAQSVNGRNKVFVFSHWLPWRSPLLILIFPDSFGTWLDDTLNSITRITNKGDRRECSCNISYCVFESKHWILRESDVVD